MIKNKKKLLIAVCAIGFVIAVVLSVYFYQKSAGFITFSQNEITRAYITNGNNGQITELTGADLKLIYHDFKEASLKEVKGTESSGWSYTIDFYVDDKITSVEMVSPTIWKISNKRYEVSEKVGNKIMKDISNIEE